MSDMNLDPLVRAQIGTSPDIAQERLFGDEDPAVDLLRHVEVMLKGGTFEGGLRVPEAIQGRIAGGLALKHMLILQADKDEQGRNLVASDIPFNRGILHGFGMDPDSVQQIRGGRLIEFGKSGLVAFMQPLWNLRYDLTEAESLGMKKRLYNGDGERTDSGIIVLPQFALRAVFQNVKTLDPEMQINVIPEV